MILRKPFLAFVSIHFCWLLLATFATADDRPNILLIVGDDMGFADLGVNGCKDIPTPHLDALAAAGVRCTNGYDSAPYCSPTRAGMLTGRYQTRFGHEMNPGGEKPNKKAAKKSGTGGKEEDEASNPLAKMAYQLAKRSSPSVSKTQAMRLRSSASGTSAVRLNSARSNEASKILRLPRRHARLLPRCKAAHAAWRCARARKGIPHRCVRPRGRHVYR